MARHPARAEVVGSLLRPKTLRAAVDAFYGEGHRAVLDDERAQGADSLHIVEDEAIAGVVQRQIDLGLDVVTDGEFRRYMFLNSFWDAVRGFSTEDNPVEFRNDSGDPVVWHVHKVVDRLEQVDSPVSREAAFMATTTDHPFKVTLPAGSIFSNPYTWKRGVNDHVYSTRQELTDHAVTIERQLVADAVAEGAGYVQFDFPMYPFLVDDRWRRRMIEDGFDLNVVMEEAIAADRAVLEGIPDGVTTGLHICRGNYRSRYLCEGSLESLAERIFNDLDYDVFLVEWEDPERMGDVSPIRFVPPGKTLVLGVVGTKTPRVQTDDELTARLEDAARFLDFDQLAVSPQCGFASVIDGNEIPEDTQWEKLASVGRVADRIWG
ncbi:MAG TPA: cobalamin-independent methionine synthase II family protein [Acidimicrobiia bacterium]